MARFRLAGPSSLVPSNRSPLGSILTLPSLIRQAPTASKFSSDRPIGSIKLWQDAHGSLALCSSIRCRTDSILVSPLVAFSLSGGTFGGGGGGGVPKNTSMTYFPRPTGEVRVETDVNVKMLA